MTAGVSDRRPTWVEVDLEAIRSNVAAIRTRLEPGTALMAVVKADGYGHGAVAVARAALTAGAARLGVATPEEGAALREAGVTAPVLVLGPTAPEQWPLVAEYGLEAAVADAATAGGLAAAARQQGRVVGVHLKLDTGMGRWGLLPEECDRPWVEALLRGRLSPWLRPAGLMTHFATADAHPDPGTRDQLARFLDVVERLRTTGLLPGCLHAANTAATCRYPGTHFTLVRVGLGLYGLYEDPACPAQRPALRWLSRVVFAKDVPAGFAVGYGATYRTSAPARILTVPVGYADGYRRALSNRHEVLIRGRRYPVVGRVSMDQITVAV
ncbi:MAG: alanine racemase, partial [Firmicutes bacterium]|nr:alanine racemase [Bacillota bacterium]